MGRTIRGQCCLFVVATLGGVTAALSQSALPPDGAYDYSRSTGRLDQSTFQTIAMGRMEIRGTTYRYSTDGRNFEPWAPYEVSPTGELKWTGGPGALIRPPAEITESSIERGSNYTSIIIKYRVSPAALVEIVSCRHQ